MSDMPKIPEHAKMRVFHGGYPDEYARREENRHEAERTAWMLEREEMQRDVTAARREVETMRRVLQAIDDVLLVPQSLSGAYLIERLDEILLSYRAALAATPEEK